MFVVSHQYCKASVYSCISCSSSESSVQVSNIARIEQLYLIHPSFYAMFFIVVVFVDKPVLGSVIYMPSSIQNSLWSGVLSIRHRSNGFAFFPLSGYRATTPRRRTPATHGPFHAKLHDRPLVNNKKTRVFAREHPPMKYTNHVSHAAHAKICECISSHIETSRTWKIVRVAGDVGIIF